uniref:Uncharacterized protein n=1 Tax=Timema douglasi TaxID=61478 RepID=A0A7R8VFK8_TIMDO|nr:unnamed protein product [Timema douglasi]
MHPHLRGGRMENPVVKAHPLDPIICQQGVSPALIQLRRTQAATVNINRTSVSRGLWGRLLFISNESLSECFVIRRYLFNATDGSVNKTQGDALLASPSPAHALNTFHVQPATHHLDPASHLFLRVYLSGDWVLVGVAGDIHSSDLGGWNTLESWAVLVPDLPASSLAQNISSLVIVGRIFNIEGGLMDIFHSGGLRSTLWLNDWVEGGGTCAEDKKRYRLSHGVKNTSARSRKSCRYTSPMASLVLIDSSQLTSDSQHLGGVSGSRQNALVADVDRPLPPVSGGVGGGCQESESLHDAADLQSVHTDAHMRLVLSAGNLVDVGDKKRCFQYASATRFVECEESFVYYPSNDYIATGNEKLRKASGNFSSSSSSSSSSSFLLLQLIVQLLPRGRADQAAKSVAQAQDK